MKSTKAIPKVQSDEKATKRVAAYCRVSSQTDRLEHSLAAQVNYFTTLI